MDVQATLLYRTLRPVDHDAFIAAVNAWFGTDDLAMQYSPAAGQTHVLFSNPHFHAVLTVVPQKIEPAAIMGALRAPVMQIKDFDYADALSAHKLQVQITVGDGPMHVSADIRQWMNRMGKHQTVNACPLDIKLCVLNGLVQQLVAHDVPELVYWAQSDMLFSPEEVTEAADMLFPLPLLVSPEPIYGSGGATGVRLNNSESFAGRTLVMEPSLLPFAEALGISMWLLSQRVSGQLSLEHGAALETPGFPTLYLRHEAADARDGKGRIVITEHKPESRLGLPGLTLHALAAATPAAPVARATVAVAPAQSNLPVEPAPQTVAAAQPAPAPAPAPAPQPMPAPAPQAAAPAPTPAPAPQPEPQVAQAPAPVAQPAPTAQPFFTSSRVESTPSYAVQTGTLGTMAALHAAAMAAAKPKPAPETAPQAEAAEAKEPEPQPAEAAPAEAPHAEAETEQAQPDQAAQPTPPHPTPKPVAKQGWANAAQRANPFDLAAPRAAPPVAQPVRYDHARETLKVGVPDHHRGIDVAAGLRSSTAVQPAAQGGKREKMRALLKSLPLRSAAGMIVLAIVLAAGLTGAPHLSADQIGAEKMLTLENQLTDPWPTVPGMDGRF